MSDAYTTKFIPKLNDITDVTTSTSWNTIWERLVKAKIFPDMAAIDFIERKSIGNKNC